MHNRKLILSSIFVCLAILQGCSVESKFDRLESNFISHEGSYRELEALITKLDKQHQIKGFGVNDLGLTLRDDSQIDLQQAKNKWPSSSREIDRLFELGKSLDILYANLDEQSSFWITHEGGGVLGTDIGIIMLQDADIRSYKNTINLVLPVKGKDNVYTIAF